MRFARLKLVLVFALCLFTASASMATTEPHPQVSSMSHSENWTGLVEAQNARLALYAMAKPVRGEGNMRAQAEQEARSYTPSGDIEGVICSVFTTNCAQAVRVARCESGLNPNAANPSGARGLFQLLGHQSLYEAHGWSSADWADPYVNTVVAHDLWRSSGWSPWVCAS